jgi:rhodanese-related sulfurtransferase
MGNLKEDIPMTKPTALAAAALLLLLNLGGARAQGLSIQQATLMETGNATEEISTDQLRRILTDRSAIVIDTRPRAEFDVGHIPGARMIDAAPSQTIDAIAGMVTGNTAAALVLYCNGPYCQASRRLAERLTTAGFTNVRRYQLGMPVWRALGGPTVVESDGVRRIFALDKSAVFIDARPADEFAKGSLPDARNLTLETLEPTIKGMMSGQLHDAPLPLDDFNRRIVLFGRDGTQARTLADAMSKRPWHNVAYFPGSYEEIAAAVRGR